MKKNNKAKAAGSLAALGSAALLMLIACDARLTTREYNIADKRLDGPIRLAMISDLHSCRYGKDQSELIKALEKAKPDILLLGGDIFDDEVPHKNAASFIKGVSGKFPCYYVPGNHEYRADDTEKIFGFLKKFGIRILAGEYETVDIRGQKINICGVTDPEITEHTDSSFGTAAQLKALNSTADNGYYTVLLAHRPELFEKYCGHGFDLVLTGHAHGGQWRIPVLLNGLFAPNQGLFPKYAGGEYRSGSTVMIVSRGLARESTPIPRVFNRPELVIVNLDKK